MIIEGLESEKIFITQALITDAEAGSLTNEPIVTLGYFGATVNPLNIIEIFWYYCTNIKKLEKVFHTF